MSLHLCVCEKFNLIWVFKNKITGYQWPFFGAAFWRNWHDKRKKSPSPIKGLFRPQRATRSRRKALGFSQNSPPRNSSPAQTSFRPTRSVIFCASAWLYSLHAKCFVEKPDLALLLLKIGSILHKRIRCNSIKVPLFYD